MAAKKREAGPRYCVVVITCPSQKEAVKVKDLLLHNRLAACVNIIGGIRSSYWWRGKIESASEIILLAKTTRAKFKEIVTRVTEIHPYDIPEIITLPISAGNQPYLKWIDKSLEGPE
jgi:periplasmic divalent cation tolerance protein